ncbi:MAG: hypothetical protein LC789_15935 [Actinobacteria bacterium]|nr:hypothetical protein [Actinomycetota bacterium]MCA1721895.1 hypothetical protein [Actinomycetota bacterium]
MPGARVGALALLLGALLLGTAPAAYAHGSDPRIVTVLDDVQPPLPTGVVVQVQANLAAQLVAQNPTARELVVLARGGEPFLKLSSAGVFANLESPDFYETSNPNGSAGAAPERVRRSGGRVPPRFVRISPGDSWGWYDHRLHPSTAAPPAEQRRQSRVADFVVPMTYGGQPLRLTGHLQFKPLLGGFSVDAAPAPAGLTVQLLQGRLPGVLLSAAPGIRVTVEGVDGQPFLRFGPSGAEVNTASRTYVEDRTARGEAVPPAAAQPRWKRLPGSSYTWLDVRLRYPSEDPPDKALQADAPTEVSQWRIPVTVGGTATALTGAVRWVPDPALRAERPAASSSRTPVLLGVGAFLLLAAGRLLLRLRR